MAKVTVGGTTYEVPEMNFAALERAWPYVDEAMQSLDPMKGPSAGISIIAAGLMEADHFDKTQFGIGPNEALGDDETFHRVVKFLKKKLKAKEIEQVRVSVNKITEEAGLEPAPGEAKEDPEKESLSPETAPDTSQSSLPQDVKEVAG